MVSTVVEENAADMEVTQQGVCRILLLGIFFDIWKCPYDQSARARYYSARCHKVEHVCDILLRLNGYARPARLKYEKGGADTEEHVEHFLLNCVDDNLMDFIDPLRIDDIQQVENIISHRMLREKRKYQRDRVKNYRSPEPRQRIF